MKTKRIIFLVCLASLTLGFIENKDIEKIWTDQCKIDRIINYETDLNKNSEFLDINGTLSESVYPFVNQYKIAKPIIVKREQTGFLPLYAEYFYSSPDSIIRYISYDWERDKFGNFFKKQELWKEESKKIKDYNIEYERIKKDVISQLGKPKSEDTEPQKIKSDSGRGDYYTRTANWETDTYNAELGMFFESMTYRIRLTYYWKK